MGHDEDLYRLLVESVSDYAIYAMDPSGRILSWNAGAERAKGYTADEAIGRNYAMFFTQEDVHAGAPARALEIAERTGRYHTEGWRIRKDGTRFWAEAVVTARRDETGALRGFAKITRDLTERRAAEEQARRLAAESAARAEAEQRGHELADLTEQLQLQTIELETQTEEARSLTEELESTNVELQRALDLAESAEAFTRNILESIADPFVVLDRGWRIRYLNPRAVEVMVILGRGDRASAVGKVLWELFPELIGSSFEREMRRSAEQRVPVTFEAFYPERGTWAQVICYPLADGGLATQWKDITRRKQAEESAHYLAKASQVLSSSLDYEVTLAELSRLVVPQLADWCSIEIVGEDGRTRQIAVMHSDPAKVEIAREISRRYPPDPNATAGVPHVIRTGESALYPEITDEMLVRSAVDEEHLRISRQLDFHSAIIVPIAARGRTLGALTLVSSESRRRYGKGDLALAEELGRRAGMAVDNATLYAREREARDAAEAANRAKSDFLATMSHELRTPLNAISGYAELLELGVHGKLTESQHDAVSRIQRSQRHLLALINDVLNFARIETGHVVLDVRDVRVREILERLEPLVAPQLHAKSHTYVVEPVDGRMAVRADADKTQQILLNLLSNAIKFTPSGGTITVGASRTADGVALSVRDTGVGIAADKLERIFDPFVQLGRALTRQHEGAGLGLAISRDLARAMDGDLVAESTPGAGSRFVLTLPAAD